MSVQANRSAPPEDGLPIVESVCPNGHRWGGELAWLLPLVFPEDLDLTGSKCPKCGAALKIAAGTYEPDRAGIYRRVGPPDTSLVVPILDA
jgi:hypothetical protein